MIHSEFEILTVWSALWIAFKHLSSLMIHSLIFTALKRQELWIAFKHLSSLMIHSLTFNNDNRFCVVNCFQTLIFIDDSQYTFTEGKQ